MNGKEEGYDDVEERNREGEEGIRSASKSSYTRPVGEIMIFMRVKCMMCGPHMLCEGGRRGERERERERGAAKIILHGNVSHVVCPSSLP